MKTKKRFLFLLFIATAITILYVSAPGFWYRYFFYRHIDCPQIDVPVVSPQLKDNLSTYMSAVQKNADIKPCDSESQLDSNSNLIAIADNDHYLIDKLTHSYPYLTKDGVDLLNAIGIAFHEQLEGTPLEGTKIIITSLTRTTATVSSLRKQNGNAVTNSAHLYGGCFDISYRRFYRKHTYLNRCHNIFLKETLAQVILELQQTDQCWATTERRQQCFHVVAK